MKCPECGRSNSLVFSSSENFASCLACCAQMNVSFQVLRKSVVVRLPDSIEIERRRAAIALEIQKKKKDVPEYVRLT